LNSSTLLSLGETKFLMWSSIVSSVVNIILNITLIFWMGMIGAAIATTLSLILVNILISLKCHKKYRINPFTRNYLKPIIASILAIIPVYILAKYLIGTVSIWMIPMLFIFFLVIYSLSILFTKSFDREDMMIINSIENKLQINLDFIKRVLRRFT
ncbi:MAG: polysaccharide biosynthesis C-terminal domain-containing protein, partial [Methanomassiliicoccales archaeon]